MRLGGAFFKQGIPMPITIKNRWTHAVIATVEDTDDLREAVIRLVKQGVDLRGANLTDADLTEANLDGADLARADLTGANLTDADLTDADLTPIENDLYAVFAWTPAEVPALIAALEQGRVNGSCYSDGACGCLIGTLAMAAGADPKSRPDCEVVHGLKGDSGRPIESLFLAIQKGDTPETNPVAKLVHGWATGWLSRMRAAFGEFAKT